MMTPLRTILAVMLLFTTQTAAAQSGGQFCLRAFEDRNENSVFDSGEPFLTRGVSANLLNADGVIVGSALMDDSPNAAQGVICFQYLAAGEYSLVITSPEYRATSPDTVSALISEGTLPTVVEYGAQRLASQPAAAPAPSLERLIQDQRSFLQRVVLSVLGALVVMAGMTVLGVLVYLIAFRALPAPQTSTISARTPTTGSLPAVKADDTGSLTKN